MKSFITILLSYIEITTVICIQCSAPAQEWSIHKKTFDKSAFWTVKFVGVHPSYYPSYRRFAGTRYRFEGNTVTTRTYINPPELFRDQYPNNSVLWCYKHQFIIDDDNAIFETKETYISGKVEKKGGVDKYYAVTEILMEDLSFALIHASSDLNFFVFQSCDLQSAWVQVAGKVMRERKIRSPLWISVDAKIHEELKKLKLNYSAVEDVKEYKLFYQPDFTYKFEPQ